MPEFTRDGITTAYDITGTGAPLLLLHGFPQTRALWAPLLPRLAQCFTVVTADLRGYGASSKPPAEPDLSNYSFRAMGGDLFALMSHLGFGSFHLAGHDRGARTAHRMALDAPERIESLTVMDIIPTLHLIETWEIGVGTDYYHWTFLAQPAPLPERMIGEDPDRFYESCFQSFGSVRPTDFPGIGSYRTAWRDPATIHGMTSDYRAALGPDRAHDTEDRDARVHCPTLVLYGAEGVMARRYDVRAVWAPRLTDFSAKAIPGGHFFVDTAPDDVTRALLDFLP